MGRNAAMHKSLKESAVFLRQMAMQPREIGSVIPSSKALGRAIVSGIDPSAGNVIEFGGGTGRLTEAILASGVAPENLVVFEINETFYKLLKERFPEVKIMPLAAQRISEAPIENVTSIISGLPLLSFPSDVTREILTNAFEKLEPNGEYVQFTYGTKPPVPPEICEDLGLTAEKRSRVFWNLPPASVYVFRKPD